MLLAVVLYRLQQKSPHHPIIRILTKYKWPILLVDFGFVLIPQIQHPFSTLHQLAFGTMLVIIYLIMRADRKNNQ